MIGSNLNAARIAGLALVALLFALALPAIALAQDPSIDQYAPGTPGGGGETSPDPGADPNPNPTDGSGELGDLGGSGSNGSGDGTSAIVGSTEPVAPTTGVTDSSSGSGVVETTATGEPVQNKAQRDLATIAAGAEQERATVIEASADANPATELLRSDSGGGPGMGIFIWILLGGTLVWAIGSGVIRHRQDGHTA